MNICGWSLRDNPLLPNTYIIVISKETGVWSQRGGRLILAPTFLGCRLLCLFLTRVLSASEALAWSHPCCLQDTRAFRWRAFAITEVCQQGWYWMQKKNTDAKEKIGFSSVNKVPASVVPSVILDEIQLSLYLTEVIESGSLGRGGGCCNCLDKL